MKFYELNELIRKFEFEIDEETGEILNFDELTALNVERDEKLENLSCFVKELRAEGKAIQEESDNLKARAKRKLDKADRLEQFLAHELNGQTISNERVEVTWRKSERVEISDESKIPSEFMVTKTKVETNPDKTAIKKAIKGGKEVAGAYIQEYNNIKIN